MDPGWSATLVGWHDFFMAAATGAATFSGLLFVGLSINVDVIVRDEKLALRVVTQLAFSLYMTVFLTGLLLLLPNPTPAGTGWTVGLVAVAALLVPAQQGLRFLRTRDRVAWSPQYLPWLVLPVLLEAALLRTAFGLAGGDSGSLETLAVLLALTLLTAAVGSWQLLVAVARVRLTLAARAPEEGRDKGLERQIRAVVREQRAINRRLQDAPRPASPVPPVRTGERGPRG